MADRVVVLSIPQLRMKDVTPGGLATLEELSRSGGLAELIPAFPGTAASSFATLMTGKLPSVHGIVGDTYYDRSIGKVATRPLSDSAVLAPKIWERLKSARPDSRTMLWFAPNTRGAAVDFAAWTGDDRSPATEPAALANDLVKRFGPFPCPRPGCEPPRRETVEWTLKTAAKVIDAERPDLAIIRVAYLGQVSRRFGPDGGEAGRAVRELESCLGPFLSAMPKNTLVLAVTESVTTPVSGPVFPNLALRELGLLKLIKAEGGGLEIDPASSAAFALADHQICHVYVNDPAQTAPLAAIFSGPRADGIARVAALGQRAALGMDHPRSGEIILVSSADRWFAADWWTDPNERPSGSTTGSGLSRPTAGGPLPIDQVLGSLGAPAPDPTYHGVVVASLPAPKLPDGALPAIEFADLIASACGLGENPSRPRRQPAK